MENKTIDAGDLVLVRCRVDEVIISEASIDYKVTIDGQSIFDVSMRVPSKYITKIPKGSK